MSLFGKLGLNKEICDACKLLEWTIPTQVQEQSIPPIIAGKNLVALAETGSGKTGAYALPIVQRLIEAPISHFAIILTPTRELAMQVQQQFQALGKTIGLSTVLLVGGIPSLEQAKQMRLKPPHVIIATPGRLLDHIRKTKGFDEIKLRTVKFLVIDEADRMMGTDFIKILEKILTLLPRERQTLLFSATMTDKVNKLTKAAIRDPVRISTRKSKFQSMAKLKQFVYLVPHVQIDAYLMWILRFALGSFTDSTNETVFPSFNLLRLNHLQDEEEEQSEPENKPNEEIAMNSAIVFTRKKETSNKLALLLRQFITSPVIALNGDMPQAQRIGALAKFKSTPGSVLVATDIASRGLDIPQVGLVINYDVPLDAKTYMHRIGRTARAGRTGCALTLLTQYSVVFYVDEIEKHLMQDDGKTQLKVPSILEADSEEDKQLEMLVDELQQQVCDASSRAKKTVTDLKRGKRTFAGAFTSVQDVRTPTEQEVSAVDLEKPGLKRSQWGSEATEERKNEMAKVLSAISTTGDAVQYDPYEHFNKTKSSGAKKRHMKGQEQAGKGAKRRRA